MVDDSAEAPKRWTAKRRATLVLSILKGATSAQAVQATGWRWPRWRNDGTGSCSGPRTPCAPAQGWGRPEGPTDEVQAKSSFSSSRKWQPSSTGARSLGRGRARWAILYC